MNRTDVFEFTTLSQSNKIYYTIPTETTGKSASYFDLYKVNDIDEYTLGCDIIINTTQLSQFSYEDDYDFREKLMYQMSQDGISNKDISDYLNEHKIQPKRTEKYTTKLVWGILKKYRLKLERQKHVEVRYENIGLYKRVRY